MTVVSPTSTEEDTEWPAIAALNADDEAEAAAEEPEAAAELDRAELEAARDDEPVAWLKTDEAADSADAVLLIPAPESALAAADDNPLMLVVSAVAAEIKPETSVPPEASEATAEVISEATAVSVPAKVSVARAVAVPARAVSVPATVVSVPTIVSVATAVVSWRLTLAA